MANPYRSPDASADLPLITEEDRQRALTAMGPPAFILLLLSMVAILLDFVVLMEALFHDMPTILQQYRHDDAIMIITANVGGNVLISILHVFILYGALNMLWLRRRSIAVLAATIAVIPFCSPAVCLGIPIAIWALLVIQSEQVRMAFEK